jgi:hypothetical protein
VRHLFDCDNTLVDSFSWPRGKSGVVMGDVLSGIRRER